MRFFLVIVTVFLFIQTHAQVSDFNTVDFTKADEIALSNKGESLQNLSLLSYNLTSELTTDVEKFRAIYTWVCNNINGDANQYRKVIKKQKKYKDDSLALLDWNNKYKKVAFKKLLKHKKTMCTGYAYLIKELSFLADLECKIIDGYGRTAESNIDSLDLANHSWNAVKLDEKWYLCDATWSSGYSNERNTFIRDYNDGYFLTDPELFSKNHFPINEQWLLNNTTTPQSFVEAPLVYGDAFMLGIFPVSPTKMKTQVVKNEEVLFSFSTETSIPINQISLVTYSNGIENSLNISSIEQQNGMLTFKSLFKYRGIYDVHLKIGDAIVTTYTIQVVKSQLKL